MYLKRYRKVVFWCLKRESDIRFTTKTSVFSKRLEQMCRNRFRGNEHLYEAAGIASCEDLVQDCWMYLLRRNVEKSDNLLLGDCYDHICYLVNKGIWRNEIAPTNTISEFGIETQDAEDAWFQKGVDNQCGGRYKSYRKKYSESS